MPKVFEVYNKALSKGKEAGVLSQDVRILIAHAMGYAAPIDVLYFKDQEMTKEDEFQKGFERLLKGEPVQYIVKEDTFLEFKLNVDERVLIPRMETQELVANITERIHDYYDPRNYLVVADIGTGSGAIALTLKTYFHNWLVTATDISEGALEVAKSNFEKYNAGIRTLQGRSLEPLIKEGTKLDIIVSNPPYIVDQSTVQPSVSAYEPASALYLDKENSVYEDIFKDLQKVKKDGVLMCFEVAPDIEEYLKELMGKYLTDYTYEFIKDLNGFVRFLFVYVR